MDPKPSNTQALGTPSEPDTRKIGEYLVEKQVGEGGMGQVFACRDLALDRRVAIKILLPEVAGEAGMTERFLREARAMATLNSPRVVTVYHVGSDGDLPFLVMEFLDGEDLGRRVKRDGPQPIDAVIEHALQTIEGLQVADAAGLVHRDIKPSNLFLTAEGIKVTDFGLARPLDGSADLTQAGLVVGSPYYLAPELARGKPASAQSDIYALGASLCELLTGKPPFRGQAPMDVVSQHLTADVPDLRERRPELPEQLNAVVQRMLAKRPDQRFPDYQALDAAIRGSETAQLTATTKLRTPPAGRDDDASSTLHSGTFDQLMGDAPAAANRLRSESLAIMFTEIPDYAERTGLQSREQGERWQARHRELLLPLFRHFGGTLVKGLGQAYLVRFRSPTNAVLCGTAIQDRLFQHNQEAAEAEQIRVRVAISVGEVRVHRGDVFGEPVNLTARILALAEAGQVLLSDAAHATMTKAEVAVASLGPHQLKGIDRAVEIFAVQTSDDPDRPPYGGHALQRVPLNPGWTPRLRELAANLGRGLANRVVVGGLVAVVGVLAVVGIAQSLLGKGILERIDGGEAAGVLKELETIPAADRTDADRLLRGHALYALDHIDKAMGAYLKVAERGEVDDRALRQVLEVCEYENAPDAVEVLVAWPDSAVEKLLRQKVRDGDWWARHNAIKALDGREVDTVDLDETLGLRDLEGAASCQRRRMGLMRLKRSASSEVAIGAIQEASRRQPDNLCMMLDFASAEQAVQRRLDGENEE